MKTSAITLSLLIVSMFANGQEQKTDRIIQMGNDFYKQNQFSKAEIAYKQAADAGNGDNTTADFNRANAMIRQNKNNEASKLLDQVIMNSTKPDLQSKAYYNQGVLLTGERRLEESIEAYKNSLRRNPDDKDARENLQKALLELKKRTPPPPKKENKKNQQKKEKEQPKMDQKEAEQRLQLLDQKEKEIQQRMQQAKTGVGQQKDW